ncbi:hypothetical protein Ancab_011119 [Ancistrocladus abbreviatus]
MPALASGVSPGKKFGSSRARTPKVLVWRIFIGEFSESLRDMGDCLLEKASLYNDEETEMKKCLGGDPNVFALQWDGLRLRGNPLCSNSRNVHLCGSLREDDGDSQDMLNSTALCLQACLPPYEKSPASPECFCAAPLLVGYRLKSPGFSDFRPYRNEFQEYLSSGLDFTEPSTNGYRNVPSPSIEPIIPIATTFVDESISSSHSYIVCILFDANNQFLKASVDVRDGVDPLVAEAYAYQSTVELKKSCNLRSCVIKEENQIVINGINKL